MVLLPSAFRVVEDLIASERDFLPFTMTDSEAGANCALFAGQEPGQHTRLLSVCGAAA